MRTLAEELEHRDLLSSDLRSANVVVVNSHHWGASHWRLFLWKLRDRKRRIVHRVDGPLEAVRGGKEAYLLDRLIFKFNRALADASIFQSTWSRDESHKRRLNGVGPIEVILNGANPSIFYPRANQNSAEKTKIIASSWSTNLRKGFETYAFLDANLDWDRFDFTFVGNAPFGFENIKVVAPMNSRDLAEELRAHDVYITASIDDPCSNSLVEAISAGLVPVALRSGGHPELVQDDGFLFNDNPGALVAIEKAADRSRDFPQRHSLVSLTDVVNRYVNVFEKVGSAKRSRIRLGHYVSLLVGLSVLVAWRGLKRFASFLFGIRRLALIMRVD